MCLTAEYPDGEFWRLQIGANLKSCNKIRTTKQTQEIHLVGNQFKDESVSGDPNTLKTTIKCSTKYQDCVKQLDYSLDLWFLVDL